MKSYLINLDRDKARLAHMRQSFGRSGIDYERLSATDGALLADPGRAMTRGELGCLISHRRALDIIAGGADRYAAVFEDDIHIAPTLAMHLADEGWIPSDADIVKLETRLNPVYADVQGQPALSDQRLVRLRSTHYGMAGYVVSAEAAAALCRRLEEPVCAVDITMFEINFGNAPNYLIYQVEPALCIQDDRLKTKPRDPRLASNLFEERRLLNLQNGGFRKRVVRFVNSATNRVQRRIDGARKGYVRRKIPFAGTGD